jgi:hypothetical protein
MVELSLVSPKKKRRRRLVADTGGGSDQAPFELVLLDSDCQYTDVAIEGQVQLSGAFVGWFNVYSMIVRISALGFEDSVLVAGVPKVPIGFDGIACFRFLNRFRYGNFGDRNHFGLAK